MLAARSESNFQIHVLATMAVVALMIILPVTRQEVVMLVLVTTAVLISWNS
jgi:diacylglycerol kinase